MVDCRAYIDISQEYQCPLLALSGWFNSYAR